MIKITRKIAYASRLAHIRQVHKFSSTQRSANWDMNVLIPIFCVLRSTYKIWSTCYKDFSRARALIKK